MFEEGIFARLLADNTVVSLVGEEISPGRRAQASPLPSIVVTTISGAPLYVDSGEAEPALATGRVQVDCYGATYSSAKAVARAVKGALSAFVGDAGGVTFQNILVDAERDFSETGSNAAEYLYRTNIDLIVWYRT